METLDTLCSKLTGISSSSTYSDGTLKSCTFKEENRIQTPIGEVIPQYRTAVYGERQKKHRAALTFFKNGQLKSAALEEATALQTPIGEMNAELVTFYDNGSLNRIFPLNGQIDGYWSETNEGELAEVLDFDLSVGKFSAKIINAHFYPSGAVKSITLWPGQKISIQTPVGEMSVRTGFSLYEDGSLKTVEPSAPFEIQTPIGPIKAFDAEMVGINSDQSSVRFDTDGTLTSLKTIHTGIRAVATDNSVTVIEPFEAPSLIEMTEMRTIPMEVCFDGDKVQIVAESVYDFDIGSYTFKTFQRLKVIREACAACSGCGAGGGCCQG
ncbi:hypothetical protein [Pelagicoccus albus]|uniref:Uncharacterized protein n=1 Tax=Pelagicoccus albus TaxID=415222 RepID=A0A7X1E9C9_9BACT|nr:hypothetical protein [Pelagicoccus albus]MBC2607294.1 hypothetical protein [Pelagicoccus albus]